MTIAGIVAEYNPFHLGHQHQIQETRRRLGPDCAVVCVMSGDFVQRGEPAVFSKFARAEAAVRCGADLVIELPLPWCMASAEQFARGAVGLLDGLGVVDVLSFGSECGNAELLRQAADSLNSAQYRAELRRYLDEGLSFAVCRQKAMETVAGEGCAEVLTRPNDNLAVEYLRAVRHYGAAMEALAVPRIGAGHDARTEGPVRSGAELRELLALKRDIGPYLPEEAGRVFREEMRQGRGPVTLSALEPLILSRLRMLDASDFSNLPDAGEGLERKLFSACQIHSSLAEIYDSTKSKRYTHARIRRMTLSAALGIQKSQFFERPPYARILALNSAGRAVLKAAKEKGTVPILSKPAAVRDLEAPCHAVFTRTSRAHDLYVLSYQNAGNRAGGQDLMESPRWIC